VTLVGTPSLRKEDLRLVTGRGRYVDDVTVPGMLHAAFVRSPHARARIVGVDTSAAGALPGVVAVFTGPELNPDAHELYHTLYGPLVPRPPQRPLATEEVKFVGDPVVLVIARDRYVAEDACDLVEIEYEPLPPVLDPREAVADTANVIHPELGSNVASSIATIDVGGAADAVAQAAHVVSETIRQHRYACVPMETSGILVSWDAVLGQLTVWKAAQNAHEVRAYCARALAIPEHRIRVIVGDVGGAFGQKAGMMREEVSVLLASHRIARPVKWIEDRQENLMAGHHAREDIADITMAVDEDGRLLAADVVHYENVGAYPLSGNMSIAPTVRMLLSGPYRLPALRFANQAAYTDTCGRCSYRGPWMFETTLRETMVDIVARRIGLDPLEFRRRNVMTPDELPYRAASGMTFDRVTPAETLERAAEVIGYDDFRRQQADALAAGRCLGVGISLCIEPTAPPARFLAHEVAEVRIDKSGSVTVIAGTASQGQSVETTMSQIVADGLGVRYEDVTYLHNDTAIAPAGGGSGGSRAGVIAGGACHLASEELRQKVLAIAAHAMEASPDDLQIADGVISVRGTPTKAMTLAEVATIAYVEPTQLPPGTDPGLEASRRYSVETGTLANACHMCTCEVDITTGQVRILRYVVSEDCGVMINPMIVEGQIAGGVIQGIGGVLYEHMRYDGEGNPVSTTFLDYLLPTTTEVPVVECDHVETPSERIGGYKGVGEGGAVAGPAAVVNAVADALAQLGITVTSQPLGPSQILDLIAAAQSK
jgi:carbon-monoxide dehydrogenase large subunit